MQLFSERGVVPHYREGMFLDASWLAVYFGQNVVPRHYDPRSDQLSTVELEAQLLKLRGDYATAVDSLPGHEDFLRERGAHYRAMGAS
jgi:tryptophan halogenase